MTARTPTNARSIPTAIRSTPSSVPYEAMAVSQQTHIDELVQKNRTLDHVAKKLKDELILEQTRSKEAAKAIKAQWKTESDEWREGCDSLQACHRIAHLRTVVELDKERLAVVKEKDVARQERVARLQRDYRITMFQVRESELEATIEDLEEDLEELGAQAEEDKNALVAEYQEGMEKLKAKCAECVTEVVRVTKELKMIGKEKEKLDTKYSNLREEHAELTSTAASTVSKLERTALQRDGAQTEITELQRLNDEYKRNNSELKRQMDKWQNLETKGGAEVETLRKRRIDLEVQVKELEGRLGDAKKKDDENVRALEKEKKRVEKLKESIDPWREEAEQAQELAAQHESDAADAKKKLSKAERQIERLKEQLETERKKARPIKQLPPPNDEAISEAESGPPEASEAEIEPPPQPTKSRPKPKPVSKARKDAPSDSEARPKKSAPSGSNKKGVQNDSEAEDGGKSEKAKGKRRVQDESDIEAAKQPADKKSRRKAVEDEELSMKPRSRGTARAGSELTEAVKSKKARTIRAEIKPMPAEEDDDVADDDSTAPKRKKRKINIFPASQPTSFPWGDLPQGDGNLNIPTVLSPVKDTDSAPQRSSVFGSVRSMLSFGSK